MLMLSSSLASLSLSSAPAAADEAETAAAVVAAADDDEAAAVGGALILLGAGFRGSPALINTCWYLERKTFNTKRGKLSGRPLHPTAWILDRVVTETAPHVTPGSRPHQVGVGVDHPEEEICNV